MVFRLSTCGDSRPTAFNTAYDATTRSCCAVTSATRALTSACWAFSTSSVVRCPALASSRTPLSAISEAVTCDCAEATCALPATSWPHAVTVIGAGLVAGLFEIEALLRQRFLRLADQRVFGAALIDRNRKLRDRRGAERPVDRQGLFVGLLHRGLQRHRRQQRAFVDLDLEIVDVDAEHRRGHVRIFDQAELDRGGQRSRREAIDRRARRQRLPARCR